MKRTFLAPVFLFLSAILAFAMGTLFRARLLPFLRADTILSGGSQVSTEQFARFMAKGFYVAGALTIVLGGVALLSLLAAKRRRMRKYGLSENRVGPHF